jgi:hypothetical protein
MLHTSFRVNSHIKTVLSQTQENSRLKTRYLKGITTEQLFIIFIQEIIFRVLLFYLALKNRKLDTQFLFDFLFLDHTLLVYISNTKINFYFVF